MPDTPPLDLHEDRDGIVVKLRIQPKASRDEATGFYDRALKIRVMAAPADGNANHACVTLLARLFEVPKSAVRILRGERSRQKWVHIRGLNRNQIFERLKQLKLV